MGLRLGMDIPGWPPENIEEMAKKLEQELLGWSSRASARNTRKAAARRPFFLPSFVIPAQAGIRREGRAKGPQGPFHF